MSVLSTRTPSLSIRYAIPGLLAILIVAAVSLTGWLAFRSGQQSVDVLANELGGEATTRIEEHVQAFLEIPYLFHNINLGAESAGSLNLTDYGQLRQYFWRLARLSESAPYVYYGAENGDFIGVDMNPGGEPAFKTRNAETAPNRVTYSLDQEGNPVEAIKQAEYDPRTRPWYKAAKDAGQPIWSEIYPSASAPFLVISPAAPVYDSAGKLQGVLAIDITLRELSEFLQTLNISPNGEAFIIERTGELVATSSTEPPFTTNDEGAQQRLKVVDSSETLISGIGKELVARYGGFDKIQGREQFIAELNQDRQYTQIATLKDERGLDWLIVVVIPASDFMGPVYDNARATAIAGGLIMLAAALLGYALASWIIRPVLTVIGVAANIEKENYALAPLDPVAIRSDELGQLARVFRRMAQEVYNREQSLIRQVRDLKIEIDEAKRRRQVNEIVDSEFFVDLQSRAREMRRARQKEREQEEQPEKKADV